MAPSAAKVFVSYDRADRNLGLNGVAGGDPGKGSRLYNTPNVMSKSEKRQASARRSSASSACFAQISSQ
jgi:hypothetical protein